MGSVANPVTWWARQDSNLRPWGYEPRALPLSYRPKPTPRMCALATTVRTNDTPR